MKSVSGTNMVNLLLLMYSNMTSRPKKYWSMAFDPKVLDQRFWVVVKIWVASDFGSKNLGQRQILGQRFWVIAKI